MCVCSQGFDSDDDVKLAELQAMNNGLARAASGAQGQIAQKFLSQDRLVNEQFLSLRNNELRTYKLSKSYEKTSALKECTLKMHAGEVFCLLGHNGAGKSTLVNTLTGLMAPTFGNGWIFGHSLRNVHRIQVQSQRTDASSSAQGSCEALLFSLFSALSGSWGRKERNGGLYARRLIV